MTKLIGDIEKGLEGITYQLKKPTVLNDIGPKTVFAKKKTALQLKPGKKIPSEIQTKANELITKFIEEEIYQFDNILSAIRQSFGESILNKIFPALKSGYTAYLSNADDAELEKMDSFDYVRKYELPATKAEIEEVKKIFATPKGQKPEIIVGKPGGTPEGGFKKEETISVDRKFIQRVREEIRAGNVLTKTQLEKIAKEFDITYPEHSQRASGISDSCGSKKDYQ